MSARDRAVAAMFDRDNTTAEAAITELTFDELCDTAGRLEDLVVLIDRQIDSIERSDPTRTTAEEN